jgi:hypothetical protein
VSVLFSNRLMKTDGGNSCHAKNAACPAGSILAGCGHNRLTAILTCGDKA